MAVSQTDIDNLNEAIAAGTRQVTIGGQSVTYQTTASLIQARDDMVKQLRLQTPSDKRSRQFQTYQMGRSFTDPNGRF
jgi:hypothetical protein